jgi:MraZ protein
MPHLPEGFQPLIGTDETSIDDKGRVLITKAKRDRLGENFVVMLGKSGGISCYPSNIVDQLLQEVFSVDTMNPAREEYTRLVLGNAFDEITFDAQGRMVVPKRIREEARLTGELYAIGCGDRVEIWDRDEWVKFNFAPEKYNADRREAIENAYSQMLFSRQANRLEVSA